MKKLSFIALLLVGVLFGGLFRFLVEAESKHFKFDLGDFSSEAVIPAGPQAFTHEARLATGNASDLFGSNVQISGDTAVVSSNAGFRVYVRTGTTWELEATLHPSDGDAVAASPYAMAISGNTVVIAGVGATINGNGGQGAAYVFERSGATWTQQIRLTASDGAAGDGFGRSLAINGDSIIVGAWLDDIGANANQGSVYIFVRQGETWIEQAKLVATDGVPQRVFGLIAAIGGDYAAVGTGGNSSTPSDVYVFVRSGTSWTQQAKIAVCEPSGDSGSSCFGNAGIIITPDILAFGNSSLNVGSNIAAGGVYIFGRTGSTWTQQQRLTATDGQSNDGFGSSIAMDGGSLLIGTPAVNIRAGSAYLFTLFGNTWTQQQKFQEPSPNPSNGFGGRVSVSGARFIVGVGRDFGTPADPIGAAYIYTDGSVNATPTPTPLPTSTPTITPTPMPSPTPPVTVSISGRVTTPSGLGLRNAVVSLTNSLGVVQTATTSSFGVYSFSNITPGEQYLIGVSSKRYRFASQSLTVNADMTNVDFVGLE